MVPVVVASMGSGRPPPICRRMFVLPPNRYWVEAAAGSAQNSAKGSMLPSLRIGLGTFERPVTRLGDEALSLMMDVDSLRYRGRRGAGAGSSSN